MAVQMLGIKTKFTDDQGRPLIGGSVHTYYAGTSLPQDTFSDPELTVPNTNPVKLDDTGSANIFLKGTYRVRVFDIKGKFVEEQDNVDQLAAAAEVFKNKGGLNAANERIDALTSEVNNVKEKTIIVESIADLSTINNPKDGLRVYVKSYHAGLGVGGGYFTYDSSKVAENDGGTVIDGWVRELKDYLYLSDFGAKYKTDILGVWKLFIKACSKYQVNGVIVLNDDYYTSDELCIDKSNVNIKFEGSGFIKLIGATTAGGILMVVDRPGVKLVENVEITNPRIDGGETGYLGGFAFGENGVGGTKCKNVRVYGGYIKNCFRGASKPIGTGGKGLQFENGVSNIFVENVTIENCTIAMESGGIADIEGDNTLSANVRSTTNVNYTNITAKNCDALISYQQTLSPPDISPSVTSIAIDGVQAINCGRSSIPGFTDSYGLISIDRGSNARIRNVYCYNDPSYGEIPAVVRLYSGESNNIEVVFNGAADALVLNEAGIMQGTTGDNKYNNIYIKHSGSLNTALKSPAALGSRLLGNYYEVTTNDSNAKTMNSVYVTASSFINARNTALNKIVQGSLASVFFYLQDSFSDHSRAFAGDHLVNQTLFTSTSTGEVLRSLKGNIHFQAHGSDKLIITDNGVTIKSLPTSDAGLSTGQLWNDGGILKIK